MQLILEYQPPLRTTQISISEGLVVPPLDRPTVIVIDEKIPKELIAPFLAHTTAPFFLSGGEGLKSRWMKEKLEDELLRRGLGKDGLLVAVGGGALLDLVGFVAATYMRGIGLWLVPTTLLAMVDSGIGGKNGINLEGAKNCLGTTYQPEKIMIETSFLQTLPLLELQNGCIEMIKQAFLGGEAFHIPSLLARDEATLRRAVSQNIATKIRIVEASCSRPAIREMLNFGHTIGHALEAMEGFTLSHGAAVAMGMLAEARLGKLTGEKIAALEQQIRDTGLPLKISRRYSREEWQQAFLHDKKTQKRRPRFVLFDEMGRPLEQNGEYCHEVESAKLEAALDWLEDHFVA
jgi:3-dehydroquinate synthase